VLNSVGKYTLNEWAEKDGRPLFVVRFSSSEPKDTEGGTETQKNTTGSERQKVASILICTKTFPKQIVVCIYTDPNNMI